MNLTPPLKWHGGKHYLAPKIVELMPAHTHYVEPYFGGGSVLLAKDPIGVSEVVNDINRELTNFWRVLRDEVLYCRFKRIVETIPFSEVEWHSTDWPSCSAWVNGVSWEAAVKFFVRCRQSLAGRMKAFASISRTRTRRGMNEQVSAWITAIEGLESIHNRLKRVLILDHEATDVIIENDGENTLHYLDPTYLKQTRTATEVYEHEMTTKQHVDLLEVIKQCSGKVMISGYRSDLYDVELVSWNRHDFDLPNNAAGGEEKRRMVECVWCNF